METDRQIRRTVLTAFVAGCLLLPLGCRTVAPAAAAPAAATNAVAAAKSEEDAYKEIRVLTKAIMIIRRHYVDADKTGYESLVHSALDGMLKSLDPHSQFLEADMFQDLKDDTSGEFGGLGIVIGVRDTVLTVIAPMEDTPAFRAGILAGDRILEINSEKTDGLNVRDAVRKMRGTPGTQITLKIQHETTTKDVTLTRDVIKVSSVKGTRILDHGIGYVRLTQFSEPTADLLQQALDKLLKQQLRGLVLDLRNNPGGLLTSAIEVSEKFLKPSDLIVTTRGRPGAPTPPPAKARGPYHYTDFPMVILVNGGTASAAEIVSGALQDHKRAVLVGTTTFGKGSVQSLIPIEEGLALRLTTAKYYTPSERVIHEHGIEPDIVVPVTPDEWQDVQVQRARTETPELFTDKEKPVNVAPVVDRQLERAVDLLKGILILQERE